MKRNHLVWISPKNLASLRFLKLFLSLIKYLTSSFKLFVPLNQTKAIIFFLIKNSFNLVLINFTILQPSWCNSDLDLLLFSS
jgi:hypothetical protein